MDEFGAYLEDALDLRSAPGEGELPLREVLSALPADCPSSLEVRSKRYRDEFPDPADRARDSRTYPGLSRVDVKRKTGPAHAVADRSPPSDRRRRRGETMRLSSHTLLGRVHEQVRLQVARDVRALYEFIDPMLRASREERSREEPESTLSAIRSFVNEIRTAEVEEVEILEARKISESHGGRSAALVRSIVRYNEEPTARETRTRWVRDRGIWYSTSPTQQG